MRTMAMGVVLHHPAEVVFFSLSTVKLPYCLPFLFCFMEVAMSSPHLQRGSCLHPLEGQVSPSIASNYYAWKICIFSRIYWSVQLPIHFSMDSWVLVLYFRLDPILLCSVAQIIWALATGSSVSWPLFSLSTFLLSGTTRCSKSILYALSQYQPLL